MRAARLTRCDVDFYVTLHRIEMLRLMTKHARGRTRSRDGADLQLRVLLMSRVTVQIMGGSYIVALDSWSVRRVLPLSRFPPEPIVGGGAGISALCAYALSGLDPDSAP